MMNFGTAPRAYGIQGEAGLDIPSAGGTATLATAPVPGGQVERRQQRDGAWLSQSVAIRRRDGSVWTAYARQLALPDDPGAAARATEQASSVLALLAGAVAAADTAREARGVLLDGEAPPWEAHYR